MVNIRLAHGNKEEGLNGYKAEVSYLFWLLHTQNITIILSLVLDSRTKAIFERLGSR